MFAGATNLFIGHRAPQYAMSVVGGITVVADGVMQPATWPTPASE
jgi:hypothetical protein